MDTQNAFWIVASPLRPKKRQGPLLWLFSRPRPFWLAMSLLLPPMYFLSFGPACWIASWHTSGSPAPVAPPQWMLIYCPLGVMLDGHAPGNTALRRWGSARIRGVTLVPTNARGTDWVGLHPDRDSF